MLWGHKLRSKEGPIEVNRVAYNAAFGVESPKAPQIPGWALHTWALFWRLNARRSSGDSISPLQYREIEAFCSMSNEVISPEDLTLLEAMDNAYIRTVGEERKAMAERASQASNS